MIAPTKIETRTWEMVSAVIGGEGPYTNNAYNVIITERRTLHGVVDGFPESRHFGEVRAWEAVSVELEIHFSVPGECRPGDTVGRPQEGRIEGMIRGALFRANYRGWHTDSCRNSGGSIAVEASLARLEITEGKELHSLTTTGLR